MELVRNAFPPAQGVVERSPRADEQGSFLELWKGAEQEDQETLRKRAKIEAFSGRLTQVTDWLWQSGVRGACDALQLKKNGITHVLSLLCEDEAKDLSFPNEINHLRLQMADSCTQSIYPVIIQAFKFILEAEKTDGIILVHCSQGVSRSSTIVIAYLERYFNMTYSAALGYLRRTRPTVAPSSHFAGQLAEYYSLLHSSPSQLAKLQIFSRNQTKLLTPEPSVDDSQISQTPLTDKSQIQLLWTKAGVLVDVHSFRQGSTPGVLFIISEGHVQMVSQNSQIAGNEGILSEMCECFLVEPISPAETKTVSGAPQDKK